VSLDGVAVRAVVCTGYGPPEDLVVKDVPAPSPGVGQVLIAVRAAGVNFPDTLIIQGKYQFKPAPPFTPGGEVAGVVTAVGGGVTAFAPGDHVVALVPFGGYAEQVVAGEAQLVAMPEGLDFERAASALTTYGTTQYALAVRARLAPGETLLVLGAAGGVGLAAVELGKLLGARVIAAASSAAKLETCKRHGADELIDYATEDLKTRVKELTDGHGADVIYDPVGGSFTEAALRASAWNGRLLVVGFASGEIPRLPANLTLLKGSSIIGVFWGAWMARDPHAARVLHGELLTWIRDGRIRPRLHARYPLDDASRALRELLDRKVQGKTVLVVGS
jgi:NADPH:quinone reductase